MNFIPDWYVRKEGWTESSHGAEQSGLKETLDNLHCRKIDISDKVFVCNKDGYIGESTRNEIEYANKIGKPIYYLEEGAVDKEIDSIAKKISGWLTEIINNNTSMEPAVIKIAGLMQHKINKNKNKECDIMNSDGKGRKWSQCNIPWLQMRLLDEVVEMQKAILDNESPEEIAKECADICNFSMMIADNVGGLK